MNTFSNAVINQSARTENGMKARKLTGSACVDLFYKIGASRGKSITASFLAAVAENGDSALRIALWARDVREGAGERQLFRNILGVIEEIAPEALTRDFLKKVVELGRWDDLLVFKTKKVKELAFALIYFALRDGDGLCAKWMPRKGAMAVELRKIFEWSPKRYRKTLVSLTNVVETQMCSKQWDSIAFEAVPSLAAARYRTAFHRNTSTFETYVDKAVAGEAKVNAGAVYPHDVLKGILSRVWGKSPSPVQNKHALAQWAALPNYMGDAKVLPMVDVSGSMSTPVGKSTTALEVAISLGLYMCEKNTGAFKDLVLTFSENPQLLNLQGNVLAKAGQLEKADWGMNTNIMRAFQKVLQVAVESRVSPEDMPDTLVILSDMQFDRCTQFDDSAHELARRNYRACGYKMPKIVFWNLDAHSNTPVKFNTSGVALVSGFSPSIMKSVLGGNLESFTPEAVMLETIMVPRYSI